jgi:NADH-quinone oxidoreductase subunit G
LTDTSKIKNPTDALASDAKDDGTHTFTLDGREVSAKKGELLIAAAERAGTYIPRFCYHPRMEPVGMCRMCLVEVEGPRGATLQPACFIEAGEGMVVDTTSEKVKKAQDGVLEFLLANHPLDCPVCDKGGECPLQDQTLAYGPGETRFIEEKRHFEKPIAISDLVLLDRERCIQCARCTRFASDVAGEAQIDFAGRGDAVEVSTFPTEPFSSYFSGNTVQICPVGALTATPYRFTARPWDLDQVESTCTACSVGCRVAVQSSQNRLTRLLGIDSEPVNHGWLCDKGRFSFESVNGDEVDNSSQQPTEVADAAVDVAPATASQVVSLGASRGQFLGEARETGRFEHGRLVEPRIRKEGELVPVSWGEALAAAAAGLSAAKSAGGAGAVAVIGGARLTNEAAYAWAKLAKGIIGTDSVDAQLGDGLPAELVLGLPRATIDEACAAPVLVTLAGDLREELPVLFLRLREAVVGGGTQLLEITPAPTALTTLATASLRLRPGDAPLVARALTGDAAASTALGSHPEGAAMTTDQLESASALLAAHPDGEGVVIVAGRPSYAESGEVAAEAVRALAAALPKAKFLPALRRGNVFGALDMGLAPGLLPGRVSLDAGRQRYTAAWGSVPAATGLSTADILASMAGETDGGTDGRGTAVRALVLLGADPLDDFPDRAVAAKALGAGHFVVAVTGHPSESVDAHADVVLPCAVTHERAGTTTNIEGRVSRLGPKLSAPGFAWPDWMIAVELAAALGSDLGLFSDNDLSDELARTAPAYAGLTQQVLHSDVAHDGILVPLVGNEDHRDDVTPIDPMALPGVESVERQGAPPRVGTGSSNPASEHIAELGSPPPLLSETGTGGAEPLQVPKADSYSLRLTSGRRLYDAGSSVTGSPSLTPLVPTLVVRANPYDLDRLGAKTGDRVKVRSARGELILAAESDEGVARGVVAIDFNVPGGESAPPNAVATLIDSRQLVTDVRLESV